MQRTLVAVAVVVGFATAASAGTLTVFATDLSNVATNTFLVGQTFLLKVTGDGQGRTAEDSIFGELHYNAAITDTLGATQGVWLTNLYALSWADGSAQMFEQTGPPTNTSVATSVATLLATAVGTSSVIWGGSLLDFFGIYMYGDPTIYQRATASRSSRSRRRLG